MHSFVQFSWLHWLAIGVWTVGSIGLMIAVGFCAWAMRSVLFLSPNHNYLSISGAYIAEGCMLICAAVALGIFATQLVRRTLGEKTKIGCCPYESFLFGPIQPLVIALVLTLVYAVATNSRILLVCKLEREEFADLATWYIDDLGRFIEYRTGDVRMESAQRMWDEVHRIGSTLLGFMIAAWVGAAAMTSVNIWSHFRGATEKEKVVGDAAPGDGELSSRD
jgi:hypothetical protein